MQIWCRKLANLSNSPRHMVYSKTFYDSVNIYHRCRKQFLFSPSIQIFLIQKLFTKDKQIILYPLQFFRILGFGVAPKLLCLKRCLLEQHIVVIAHKIKNVRVMKFSWSESIWYVLGENNSKTSINTTRYGNF